MKRSVTLEIASSVRDNVSGRPCFATVTRPARSNSTRVPCQAVRDWISTASKRARLDDISNRNPVGLTSTTATPKQSTEIARTSVPRITEIAISLARIRSWVRSNSPIAIDNTTAANPAVASNPTRRARP
jgi:hypothetical protein